ncbi:MAG: c-type cytochrome domain-containing protein [Fimbriimonas sp.]
MIISNKSILRQLLFVAGLAIFAVGCKSDDTTTSTATGSTATTAPPTNAGATPGVTFASVQPVMKERCLQCHNGPTGKNGVDFSSYESVMKGGKKGPIIKSGDPENSLLVQVIRGVPGHPKMPPQGDPLTEDQMKAVEDWIKAGAPG